MFEAKILRFVYNPNNKQLRYRVHYQNWKSSSDQWVTEDCLYKINGENLALKEHRLDQLPESLRVGFYKRNVELTQNVA